ncbi:hypothetical protein ACFL09_01595 [Planctomycetota bacterium]
MEDTARVNSTWLWRVAESVVAKIVASLILTAIPALIAVSSGTVPSWLCLMFWVAGWALGWGLCSLGVWLRHRQALRILAGRWRHTYQHGTGETVEVAEITTDAKYLVTEVAGGQLPSPDHRFNLDWLIFDPGTEAIGFAKRNRGGGLHGLEVLHRGEQGELTGANHNGRRSAYVRL